MLQYCCDHRRRVNTEAKAKVVAAVWGTELIKFLVAQSILHEDNLKERISRPLKIIVLTKTFLQQIILAAKWLVRPSSTIVHPP